VTQSVDVLPGVTTPGVGLYLAATQKMYGRGKRQNQSQNKMNSCKRPRGYFVPAIRFPAFTKAGASDDAKGLVQ